jgi:hypothetical protein
LRLLEHVNSLMIIESVHSTCNSRLGFGVGQAQNSVDVGFLL